MDEEGQKNARYFMRAVLIAVNMHALLSKPDRPAAAGSSYIPVTPTLQELANHAADLADVQLAVIGPVPAGE